jgi:hypothetical protein
MALAGAKPSTTHSRLCMTVTTGLKPTKSPIHGTLRPKWFRYAIELTLIAIAHFIERSKFILFATTIYDL